MNEEISFEHGGQTFYAEYTIEGDMLHVFLHNGAVRTTVLRGLDPESAALLHLKSYVNQDGS